MQILYHEMSPHVSVSPVIPPNIFFEHSTLHDRSLYNVFVTTCIDLSCYSTFRRMRRENPYSEAGEAMQRYDSTPTSRKPGGEDKWSAKPTSPVRPVTSPNPQETNINENEYASMRLLPPLPANDYRRQVMPAQLQQYAFPPPAAYHVTRDVYSPDHVYESPESMRKDNVRFSSGECPEYFDLDMQVRTPNTCTHVSGQCTCAGRPHSASLKGSAVHAGEPRSSNHVSV